MMELWYKNRICRSGYNFKKFFLWGKLHQARRSCFFLLWIRV